MTVWCHGMRNGRSFAQSKKGLTTTDFIAYWPESESLKASGSPKRYEKSDSFQSLCPSIALA